MPAQHVWHEEGHRHVLETNGNYDVASFEMQDIEIVTSDVVVADFVVTVSPPAVESRRFRIGRQRLGRDEIFAKTFAEASAEVMLGLRKAA